MEKADFLNEIRRRKRGMVKCYRSGRTVDPSFYPFMFMDLYIQERNNEIQLITPSPAVWAEYSPKYDIESFDGTTMVFVAEDWVMELRL